MSRTLNEYPAIRLRLENLEGRINFADIFGRSAPVHIEIGSGKATFLVNEATTKPYDDFLGIEWCNKIYRYAVDRVGRRGLTNVRIIRADAAAFIRDYLADTCVDCFHIYFPDPWPKKRHHKRRFISTNNLDEMLRCLKAGGVIRIATDHAEYFEKITEVMTDNRLKKVEFFPTSGAAADKGEWAGTNFERKYLKEGRPIYTVAGQKLPA
jgi:tRNA (guanine-N7-)-methyltransferase